MALKIIPILLLLAGAVYISLIVIHSKIKIRDHTWEPKIFLYQEKVGSYENIDKLLDSVDQDLRSIEFKKDTFASIHYDKPLDHVDKAGLRSAVGVLINPSEKKLAKKFIKKNTNYKLITLSDIKSITCGRFPYPDVLSSLWLDYFVLPKAWEYGERNWIFTKENTTAIINIFHRVDKVKKYEIETLIPHGKNKDQLMLTSASEPSVQQTDEL
jgi:hypothetical protein